MTTQAARVRKMFGSIAARYDIANHLLSCGIDFSWRERAARIVTEWHPHSIADLATGTGDLALALQKKLPDAEITGVDFLPEMLELARQKGLRQPVLADAMNLPFGNGSFDCVTIAFGLRNLENCTAALGRDVARNQEQRSLARARVLTAYNTNLTRTLPFLSTSLLTSTWFFLNRREKCLRLSRRFDRGISKWRCNVSADGGERFQVPDVQTAHWWNRHDLYGQEAVTAERSGRAIPPSAIPNYSELARSHWPLLLGTGRCNCCR